MHTKEVAQCLCSTYITKILASEALRIPEKCCLSSGRKYGYGLQARGLRETSLRLLTSHLTSDPSTYLSALSDLNPEVT